MKQIYFLSINVTDSDLEEAGNENFYLRPGRE